MKPHKNSLAVLVRAASVRRIRLVHCFSLLCHCIVIGFVRVVAVVIARIRSTVSRRHLRRSHAVLMPTWLHLIVVRFRRVLNLRWHDGVRRWLHHVVVFWRRRIVFVDDRGHGGGWSGAWRGDADRRRWWELWWAFWVMTYGGRLRVGGN